MIVRILACVVASWALMACNIARYTGLSIEPAVGIYAPDTTVEQVSGDNEGLDPLQAHLMARRQVNPTDTRHETSQYTKIYADRYTPPPQTQGIMRDETKLRIVPKPKRKNEMVPQTAPARFFNSILSSINIPKKPEIQSQTSSRSIRSGIIPKRKPRYLPNITPGAGGASVYGVRIGQHNQQTRFVIDLSDKTDFVYSINNNSKVLAVEILDAIWTQSQSNYDVADLLLEKYVVQQSEEGKLIMTVYMKESVDITMAQAFPPVSEGKPYRIAFDIASRK